MLARPIYEIQETVPFSEIRLWKKWFETEHERHELIHYYLAKIAMYVDMSTAVKPKQWKVRDYLIDFEKTTEMSQEDAKARVISWIKAMKAVAQPAPKPKKKLKKKRAR